MQEYLNHKFYSNDLRNEVIIRDYFKYILKSVWHEGEYFSAKDLSGKYDLIAELIKLGLIEGKLDEYNEPYNYSFNEVDDIVICLIDEL